MEVKHPPLGIVPGWGTEGVELIRQEVELIVRRRVLSTNRVEEFYLLLKGTPN